MRNSQRAAPSLICKIEVYSAWRTHVPAVMLNPDLSDPDAWISSEHCLLRTVDSSMGLSFALTCLRVSYLFHFINIRHSPSTADKVPVLPLVKQNRKCMSLM